MVKMMSDRVFAMGGKPWEVRVFSLVGLGDPTSLNRCGRSKVPAVPAVAVRQDVRPQSGLTKKTHPRRTCGIWF